MPSTNRSVEGTAKYQWTIDEYALRCELYSVKELIVEGDDDRRVFTEALVRLGLRDVAVFDGAYFRIDESAIAALGVSVGVKGGLLALAAAICSRSLETPLAARVAIVVDRDYDDELPAQAGCVALLTDGYSIENYAYTAKTLERLIPNVLGQSRRPPGADGEFPGPPQCTGEQLLSRVAAAASDIAAVRRTLRGEVGDAGLFERWLGRVRVSSDGYASVDALALLQDVITTRSLATGVDAASDVLAREKALVATDGARYVRGHDFVAILHKVLRSAWGRRAFRLNLAKIDELSFRRFLLFAIDPNEIDASPLIRALRARFS